MAKRSEIKKSFSLFWTFCRLHIVFWPVEIFCVGRRSILPTQSILTGWKVVRGRQKMPKILVSPFSRRCAIFDQI